MCVWVRVSIKIQTDLILLKFLGVISYPLKFIFLIAGCTLNTVFIYIALEVNSYYADLRHQNSSFRLTNNNKNKNMK